MTLVKPRTKLLCSGSHLFVPIGLLMAKTDPDVTDLILLVFPIVETCLYLKILATALSTAYLRWKEPPTTTLG